jgi:Raf kinase inhibitor-like YbhB/YbcL family protein
MLKLTSPAFREGGAIPKEHTGDGADRSPALAWEGVPEGAVELALLVDDPDAPVAEPWVHWIVWGIPATWAGLRGGFHGREAPKEAVGVLQGINTWGTPGYRGPAPPRGHGPHRYRFTLHALKEHLGLEAGADRRAFGRALEGKVLDRVTLTGTYERK